MNSTPSPLCSEEQRPRTRPARVHLVTMPWAALNHPSPALGQFMAQLNGADIPTRIHHFNFSLAERMGGVRYECLASQSSGPIQLGEWLCAGEAWGRDFSPDLKRFLATCGGETPVFPGIEDNSAWLYRLRHEIIPLWLDDCLAELGADGTPELVAFGCTYFQTVATVALARRIRKRWPATPIIAGGASFHGRMGEELFQGVEEFTAISTGEADAEMVPLVQSLLAGETPPILPGIIRRLPDGSVPCAPPPRPATAAELEALPTPDYSDYMIARDRLHAADASTRDLNWYFTFEASRGCWKGEQSHCRFCGLQPDTLCFRQKSARRVHRILQDLGARYDCRSFHATDNLLSREHQRELIGLLNQDPPVKDGEYFFEVRSNLTRHDIGQLAAAGIRTLQPGVENLNTHLLQCMKKGVSGIQNVHFLKLCLIHGIQPRWNMLYRVPGEKAEDYRALTALIPLVMHLPAPLAPARRIELQPSSPYYAGGDAFVRQVKPQEWYAGIYPEPHFDLQKLAYFFQADWQDVQPSAVYASFEDATRFWWWIWAYGPERPLLTWQETCAGGIRILDSRRAGRRISVELEPWEARIYNALDDLQPQAALRRVLSQEGISEAAFDQTIHTLLRAGLILREGGWLLALAVPEEHPDPRKQGWRALRNLSSDPRP